MCWPVKKDSTVPYSKWWKMMQQCSPNIQGIWSLLYALLRPIQRPISVVLYMFIYPSLENKLNYFLWFSLTFKTVYHSMTWSLLLSVVTNQAKCLHIHRFESILMSIIERCCSTPFKEALGDPLFGNTVEPT